METKKKRSEISDIWRRFKKNKPALIGLIVFSLICLVAIFGNFLADPELVTKISAAERLQDPSFAHLFGTDGYGRDQYARMIHATKYSISVGVISALSSMIIGIFLGACAALYGKTVDNIIMRLIDVLASVPSTLLALILVASFGANLINLILAITISFIPIFARLARSTMIGIIDSDYIVAARAYGTSDFRLMVRHIIPNSIGPMIVQTTMSVADNILMAASLSFVGMGIQAPTPEWGNMLNAGKEFMQNHVYLLTIPGIALVLSALSVSLLGDGLRDALDPRLKS